MDHTIYSYMYLRLLLLLIKINISESRYCPEAIGSIKYVVSCPTSKTEWDTAASKKNCSRLASHQNCSSVEQFKYHCVINGFRNETLEVCAPSRIIFGHCVEFNLHGGVIQDQMTSPCNTIFPKCDAIFDSTDAYKYPDCFDLVAKRSTTVDTIERKALTTTPTTDKSREVIAVIASAAAVTVLIMFFVIISCIRKMMVTSNNLEKRQNTKENTASPDINPLTDPCIEHDCEVESLGSPPENGMTFQLDHDDDDYNDVNANQIYRSST